MPIALHGTSPTDPQHDRLALARYQKRKEYESVKQNLGDAEALLDLWSRKQDKVLELLTPPSRPEQPDTPSYLSWLSGLACGLAAGIVRRRPEIPISAAPEPV
jgi:hypothetical protein